MSADRKRAVVTGAARGIGQATTRRLLDEGVDVLAVDLDAAGLADVEAAGASVLAVDLATEAGVDAVATTAAGSDFLVNCHGIIRLRPLLETSRQDWHDLFSVNAESIFFLCQQLGPTLRPGGAIVNLSSVSAKLTSTAETAIYATTKTAILAITRAFAYALASRDIRVNAVCPGHHRHADAGRGAGGDRGAARHHRRGAVGRPHGDGADAPRRDARGVRGRDLVPAVRRQHVRDGRGDERLRRARDVVSPPGARRQIR